MDKEYYKQYYTLERENWWFRARKNHLRHQIQKIVSNRGKLKILNVGAALGASSLMLQEFGEVTSLEYDKYCCDYAQSELGIPMINGSATELPFEDSGFDIVCAFDVIEHIEEDSLAISEMYRVCKPGGHLFLTVPAFEFLWSEHDQVNYHVRRYNKKSLNDADKYVKKEIEYLTYFNFFLFLPIAIVRILASLIKNPRTIENPKSDFSKVNDGITSKILYQIFLFERIFLENRIRLPFGISIMYISKKIS
jgi:SAM-dependent methyltransferase